MEEKNEYIKCKKTYILNGFISFIENHNYELFQNKNGIGFTYDEYNVQQYLNGLKKEYFYTDAELRILKIKNILNNK